MIPMLFMVYATPWPASAMVFAAAIMSAAFSILLKSTSSNSPSAIPFAVMAWDSSITSMGVSLSADSLV